MNKIEAWRIIEECKNWNYGQKSISLAMHNIRIPEDDIFDARRAALKKAWEVVGENELPTRI